MTRYRRGNASAADSVALGIDVEKTIISRSPERPYEYRGGALLSRLAKDKAVQKMVDDAVAEGSDNSFMGKMARNPKGSLPTAIPERAGAGRRTSHRFGGFNSAREDRIETVGSSDEQNCTEEGGQDGAGFCRE